MSQPRRYVVLDRDGTLNVEKSYLSDPDQVELLPGVAEGLKLLQSRGFGLVVLSNQSGIGRGFMSRDTVEKIHLRLRQLLQNEGVSLQGIYYCPHSPEENCECRKPSPAMLHEAARDLRFNPRDSFVVGDKCSDIEMGQRVDATTVLVLTGYGRQSTAGVPRPDFVAENFAEAAALIVEAGERTIGFRSR